MEPNDKSSAVDSSIASSFGQLQIERQTNVCGPITRLPKEMIKQIIAKLALSRDVTDLVRLRLVSTIWLTMVDDYCRLKKSLVVNPKRFYRISADFNKCAPLILNLKTFDFCGVMMKLFDNVRQLSIGFWCVLDETQIRNFAVELDSLGSLTQLELSGQLVAALPLLSRTLSRLEHIRVDDYRRILNPRLFKQLVSHLGPGCVRVYFGEHLKPAYRHIRKFANLNPHWLVNVTHLEMHILCKEDEDCGLIVNFLSVYATSLKLLNLSAFLEFPLVLTLTMIQDLSKLAHLTELKLWNIKTYISDLVQADDQLTPLASLLTCNLYFTSGSYVSPDLFTYVLSVILPNVVQLELIIAYMVAKEANLFDLYSFERYLHLFPMLRKHEVLFL